MQRVQAADPSGKTVTEVDSRNTELSATPGGEYTSMKDQKDWCDEPGRKLGLTTEMTLRALTNPGCRI